MKTVSPNVAFPQLDLSALRGVRCTVSNLSGSVRRTFLRTALACSQVLLSVAGRLLRLAGARTGNPSPPPANVLALDWRRSAGFTVAIDQLKLLALDCEGEARSWRRHASPLEAARWQAEATMLRFAADSLAQEQTEKGEPL